MNVIRDIFSILIILCVLCFQFGSVQVQASENDQMRGTPHNTPHNASSSVKPPQLQERESDISVTLTTAKIELNGSREITRRKKSRQLHNQLEESNRNDTHSQTQVKEKSESEKKTNNEKLRKEDKESNSKASPNTTREDIEEIAESARKSEIEKLLNQRKPSGEVSVDTTRKFSEDSGESTRKRKSQEWLNHEEPNSITAQIMEESPTNRKSEEDENTKRRNDEIQWNRNKDESQISNEDWKDIAEQKNNEVDQKSRKNLNENIEATSPWPKKSINNIRHNKRSRSPIFMRQKEKGGDDNKDDEEDPKLEVLNVYSLREDIIRILGSIPNINASVGVIGRTAEYNEIVLCKITENNKDKESNKVKAKEDDKYTDEEAEKKIIFIVHGLSAMGFNAVPCLYQEKEFIKLLKFYTEHLDKFDIYLIPIANPDGVSDQGVLTNKNKSPQTACSGVALDRNFDIAWNTFHVNSCHQQYPGPNAFSEPESRAVGDILHQFNNRIAAYINVHAGSYSAEVFKGDAVLYPKGYVEFNSDDDKYLDIKGELDEALRIAGFKVMSVTVDSLYNWYGKVTGTSVDYASSVYGIPYALEFVMQPYEDSLLAASDEKTSENVLTEIWKRIFDVVFTNIHRSSQNNEVFK